jgi:CxxC motif-containing protein
LEFGSIGIWDLRIDKNLKRGIEEMKAKQFICVHCPKGCVISIKVPEGVDPKAEDLLESLEVSGNKCKHGLKYVHQELVEPRRVLTSTVRVVGSERMLSVRTTEPVPRADIMAVMGELAQIEVNPPVKTGQVIQSDLLGKGIDIIATWSI